MHCLNLGTTFCKLLSVDACRFASFYLKIGPINQTQITQQCRYSVWKGEIGNAEIVRMEWTFGAIHGLNGWSIHDKKIFIVQVGQQITFKQT